MTTSKQIAAAFLAYNAGLAGKKGTTADRVEAMREALEAAEREQAPLLAKYMRYVLDEEGSDFVEYRSGPGYMTDVKFSPAEWAELERISEQIREGR